MPKSRGIAHRSTPVGYDRFQAEFTTAFCAHVGTYAREGKAMTLAQLAAALRKSPRTVEAWRDGETVPRGADLWGIMAVLPPSFTNRLLALIGLGGAQAMSGPDIDLHMLAADTAHYVAVHAGHMADGRIDHRERLVEEQRLRLLRDQIDTYFATQFPSDTGNIVAMKGGAA
ncbi:MAG: helix-turn-helix transcriptional regulator [Pseudomonadota bacterium]